MGSADHPRPLLELMHATLAGQGTPCVVERTRGSELVSSGAALWNLARERRQAWRQVGVNSGDWVYDPSVGSQRLIHLLAALLHGCVYVPCPSGYRGQIAGSPTGHHGITETGLVAVVPEQPPPALGAGFYLALRSSGSSGCPKLYLHPERNVWQQLIWHQISLGSLAPGAANRWVTLPSHHGFGLVLDLLLGLVLAQTLYVSEGRVITGRTLGHAVASYGIDFMAMVPRQLDHLVALARRDAGLRRSLAQVHVHTGGAPLAAALRAQAAETFASLVEGYGLSEAGPGVLIDGRSLGAQWRVATCSHGCPKLWIRTPTLACNVEPQRLSADGYLSTDDVVTVRDGCLEVVGRSSEMLKNARGLWIPRSKVEDELETICAQRLALGWYDTPPQLTALSYHAVSVAARRKAASWLSRILGEPVSLSWLVVKPSLEAAKSTRDALRQSHRRALRQGVS